MLLIKYKGLIFFSYPLFFVSSQISIIYPYMHMSMIVAGQGQKVHFFRVSLGIIGGFSGMF